jgi:sporulation protein YlmC with PRC-barrel domain
LSASSLIGNSVVNSLGDYLGSIEDLMIDVAGGRIAYAVVSLVGIIGLGNRLFAIPWDAFAIDTEEKKYILDIDPDVLQKAPAFDQHLWPNVTDQDWVKRVHSYYGYRPYWED